MYSTDEDLKDARKEIEDIVNRRLPKFVGEARVPSDFKYKDTQELKVGFPYSNVNYIMQYSLTENEQVITVNSIIMSFL